MQHHQSYEKNDDLGRYVHVLDNFSAVSFSKLPCLVHKSETLATREKYRPIASLRNDQPFSNRRIINKID